MTTVMEVPEDQIATLRSSIVAEPGYIFLALDAIQIELKVVAIQSGDPLMLEASRSSDMHMATAIQVFGQVDEIEFTAKFGEGSPEAINQWIRDTMKDRRYDAKQMNFAILYGATAYKIAEMSDGKLTEDEAQELIDTYFEVYHVLYDWIEAKKREARENGYVETAFGRIRPIPGIKSSSWREREAAEREVVNTIVQGTAIDIVKQMMLHMRGVLDREIRLVLQVHDEMIWEVPHRLLKVAILHSRNLISYFPKYPCHIAIGKNYGGLVELA